MLILKIFVYVYSVVYVNCICMFILKWLCEVSNWMGFFKEVKSIGI